MGDQYRSEPLEDIMDEGDLVLFDCLYTTVFRSVLLTNTPMVLIDFFDHPWTDKALSLFKKRAGFIRGGFDKENKAFIDWSALKLAIEEAEKKKSNKNFFEYYYK